jgi:hypothetical protein
MSEDLKQRIKQFNKIKFANDKSKRIIIATLNDKTVTQGCIIGE